MNRPTPTPADPGPAPTDDSLLRRLRGGDPDAATDLFFRYAEHLRAVAASKTPPDLAVRVEPDDIVQTVFRTFFRRAAAGQYEVPEGEDLWKLILVIALNKIRAAGAHHRAAKRDVRMTPQFDTAPDVAGRGDEPALAVLRLAFDEQLGRLPEGHRAIVELRIEGYEVAEIADRVKRSKRSVERVLQEFRRQLGAALFEDD